MSHEWVIWCDAAPAASAAVRNTAIACSCPVSSVHTLTSPRYLPPPTTAPTRFRATRPREHG